MRRLTTRFRYQEQLLFVWEPLEDKTTLVNERTGTAIVLNMQEWSEIVAQGTKIRALAK